MLADMRFEAEKASGEPLDSIFFGGGTPSLMDPDTVGAILEAIGKHWTLANDLEVTLEANPGSVEAGRFRGYRDAGVNRVSMGVQALNDTDLKALGRLHSVAEARAAFDVARSTFDRVSFDLIYARQNQTLDAWRAELTEAADAVDVISQDDRCGQHGVQAVGGDLVVASSFPDELSLRMIVVERKHH